MWGNAIDGIREVHEIFEIDGFHEAHEIGGAHAAHEIHEIDRISEVDRINALMTTYPGLIEHPSVAHLLRRNLAGLPIEVKHFPNRVQTLAIVIAGVATGQRIVRVVHNVILAVDDLLVAEPCARVQLDNFQWYPCAVHLLQHTQPQHKMRIHAT